MTAFGTIAILVFALIATNGFWWLHVRHLSGITSDLKDVKNDVQSAAVKVEGAAAQVTQAAATVIKG